MEYAFVNCTRDKKQGPTGAGRLLFACLAAILLLVSLYRVGPLHHMHQPSSPTTFLATGSISSCRLPENPGSAALVTAVATLDVDCSFRVGQRPSNTRSIFSGIGSQQSSSNQVPQLIQVSGLDTLTCAMTKATAGSSTVSGDMMPGQQQYVFLLQPTGPRDFEAGAYGTSFQVIEYAPLPDIHQEESLAFLLSEWSHLAPGGITQLGCNKPSLGSTRAEGGVSGSSWGLISFQKRHLLQDADGSPAASPSPSTPTSISLAPISLADYAADQPATSPTNSSGFSKQTAADKPTAPAPKAGGNSSQTTAASGPSKPSSNSTTISSNTTAAANSSNGSDTGGEAVEAAEGPADVQQQQALTAILSGDPQSNATLNGTSPVNKMAVCLLSPATGPCRASIPRWAYDATKKSCIEFVWGGCQGNANMFETMQACHDACAGVVSSALPGSVNGSIVTQGTAQPNATAAHTVSAAPLGAPANPAAAGPTVAAPSQAPAPHVYSIPSTDIPEQVIIKAPAPAAQSASAYPLPVGFLQMLSLVGLLVVCQLWLV